MKFSSMNLTIRFRLIIFIIFINTIPLKIYSAYNYKNFNNNNNNNNTYNEDYESYDSIISQLSKSRNRNNTNSSILSLESVKIHGGIALLNSLINISYQNNNFSQHTTGIEINFGIDLLSENWLAEGSMLNFEPFEEENNYTYNLKEFDLKIIYKNKIGNVWKWRLGLGLASRYMLIEDSLNNKDVEYTTPASILLIGLNTILSKNISFGAEISRKKTLISNTADQSAIDLSVRLSSHF